MTLVPSRQKRLLITAGGRRQEFTEPEEIVQGFDLLLGNEKEVELWIETLPERLHRAVQRRLEIFRRLQGEDVTLVGVLGGLGQALFIRAADMHIPVGRIPMFRLQDATGIAPRSIARERAQALEQAWKKNPDAFYPIAPVTPVIAMARELVRERLAIQELRKPMQLRFYGALREMRYVLPAAATPTLDLIERAAKQMFANRSLQLQIEQALARLAELLPDNERERIMAVTRHYANPRFIVGAREDEAELEGQILDLLKPTPIWTSTHPGPNSSLPPIKGFAAALGGGTIAETGDIRRFPDSSHFRSYARFHLTQGGGFPRRMRGTESSWNFGLNRAMWLWSTDQVGRYEHPWADLLLWKKAREMQQHPDPIPREVIDRQGRRRIVYDFSLQHLHRRACRWTGSQLLEYLHDLWTAVEEGQDPEIWYRRSSWPAYFGTAQQALKGGLQQYLNEQIPLRRRTQPQEPDEEEDKEQGDEEITR